MTRIATLAAVLVPGLAAAHPGHGAGLHGHVEEIIALAVAGAIVFFTIKAWRAR